MSIEFNPGNSIVKLCLQGIALEEKGEPEEAGKIFMQAWNEAANDFEKYLTAYFVSRSQKELPARLKWLETSLQFALTINNESVKSALPALYSNIALCCKVLGDNGRAKQNYELAALYKNNPQDKGPFYHGTKADLKPGDLLTPGGSSNYKPGLRMNHIYFTALVNGAGLAAALSKGEGSERVYVVEPTGSFENDPNVTDKKFPGNPTRSYRSASPLKIIDEVTDWAKQTPQQLDQWRQKLSTNKGNIIN